MTSTTKARAVLTIAAVVGATTLSACGGNASNPGASSVTPGESSVTIGVLAPLTGRLAENGSNTLKGVQLAAQMINDSGGIKSMKGAKIKLEIRDSQSDPTQAASAATQMLSSSNRPLAVIGAYASALTLTVSTVNERNKVPILTTSFADTLSSRGYHYTFQVAPQSAAVGKASLEYTLNAAKSVGRSIKSIAIAYGDTAAWQAQAPALRDAAKKAGLSVTSFIAYPPEITDANSVAQKLLASKPDAIFPLSYLSDGVLLVRALKANGNTAPIFGGVGAFVEPVMQKALGNDIDGLFSIDSSSPDKYGAIGDLWKQKYGTIMPQESHDNAAALYVITSALEQKPTTNSEELAQTLHSGTFSMGAAGTMPGGGVKFDAQGKDLLIEPVLVQWQNNDLVTVWPPNEASAKPIFKNK